MGQATLSDITDRSLERLIANLSGRNVRRETLNGRNYLVAPMTLIVPGVLNGSRGPLYYPPEEISRDFGSWNNTPIVINHPHNDLGMPVSARDPGVLEEFGVGYVFKARINNQGKLKAEGWFDEAKLLRMYKPIHNQLMAAKPIELSTGLFTDNELAANGSHYRGKAYTYIARNYRPDHLAILPETKGACSVSDGCGVMNYNPNHDGHGLFSTGGGSLSSVGRGAARGAVTGASLGGVLGAAGGYAVGRVLGGHKAGIAGAKVGAKAGAKQFGGLGAVLGSVTAVGAPSSDDSPAPIDIPRGAKGAVRGAVRGSTAGAAIGATIGAVSAGLASKKLGLPISKQQAAKGGAQVGAFLGSVVGGVRTAQHSLFNAPTRNTINRTKDGKYRLTTEHGQQIGIYDSLFEAAQQEWMVKAFKNNAFGSVPWDESKHKRDKGKFSSTGGASGSSSPSGSAKVASPGSSPAFRAGISDGANRIKRKRVNTRPTPTHLGKRVGGFAAGATGEIAGGIAGAKLGASVGSVAGPWGAAAGGVVGGFAGAYAGSSTAAHVSKSLGGKKAEHASELGSTVAGVATGAKPLLKGAQAVVRGARAAGRFAGGAAKGAKSAYDDTKGAFKGFKGSFKQKPAAGGSKPNDSGYEFKGGRTKAKPGYKSGGGTKQRRSQQYTRQAQPQQARAADPVADLHEHVKRKGAGADFHAKYSKLSKEQKSKFNRQHSTGTYNARMELSAIVQEMRNATR